jgi:hypothetical protein
MALNLNLATTIQSNDNTVIRIQDDTGDYSALNLSGWGAPNTALSTINGTTNALTLTVTYTDSSNITTVYEPIDVYDYLGHTPTDITDLVIYISSAMLIPNGGTEAVGEVTDELPDGWYSVEYSISVITTSVVLDSLSSDFIIDGKIRNKIYDMLRLIPKDVYTSTPYRVNVYNWGELTYPLYVLSLFEAMLAYITPARKSEVLEMMNLIQRLTT